MTENTAESRCIIHDWSTTLSLPWGLGRTPRARGAFSGAADHGVRERLRPQWLRPHGEGLFLLLEFRAQSLPAAGEGRRTTLMAHPEVWKGWGGSRAQAASLGKGHRCLWRVSHDPQPVQAFVSPATEAHYLRAPGRQALF